ncbi:hypothetical protein DSO57_1030477 [Entomophthora muscae]|uniref:Uncharacterized protein n=1 Tax=Entomophthora muscae TaxID=34485 RepID=A0ACC2SDV2_9FUNG|nr:hypothetical protein DSO57_1030477 [Entomophthora muscae]
MEGPMTALPLPDRVLMGGAPWRLCRYPIGFSWEAHAALPLPDRVLMGRASWLAARHPTPLRAKRVPDR